MTIQNQIYGPKMIGNIDLAIKLATIFWFGNFSVTASQSFHWIDEKSKFFFSTSLN